MINITQEDICLMTEKVVKAAMMNLMEGFSNILYHNTKLGNLLYISKDGCFKLNETSGNKENPKDRSNYSLERLTNNLISKNNNYSMSFSRERNSKIGFSGYMNGNLDHLRSDAKPAGTTFSKSYYARFEIDGKMLERYLAKTRSGKGGPIDYYRENPSVPIFTEVEKTDNLYIQEINGVDYVFLDKKHEIPLYVINDNGDYSKAKKTDKGKQMFRKTLKKATTMPRAKFRDDLTTTERGQIKQSEDRLVSNNEYLQFYDFENDIDYGFIKHIDIFFPVNQQEKSPATLQRVYNAIYNENYAFAKIRKKRSDFIRIFHTIGDYNHPLQRGKYTKDLSIMPNMDFKKDILDVGVIGRCAKFGVGIFLITKAISKMIKEESFIYKMATTILKNYPEQLSIEERKQFEYIFQQQWNIIIENYRNVTSKKDMNNYFRDIVNNNQLKNHFKGRPLVILRKTLERLFNLALQEFKEYMKTNKNKPLGRKAIGAQIFDILVQDRFFE